MVELLVVIVIIIILIIILIPVVSKARESARRTTCGTNLRSLAQQFRQYSIEFGEPPRALYTNLGLTSGIYQSPETGGASAFAFYQTCTFAFTCAEGDNPFKGSGTTNRLGSNGGVPITNDVTATLFLLVRNNMMNVKQFICPSDFNAFPDKMLRQNPLPVVPETAALRSNFTDRRNLSYSLTTPYPSQSWLGDFGQSGNPSPGGVRSGMSSGYRYNIQVFPNLALAADLNPGNSGTIPLTSLTLNSSSADMLQGNSKNHARAGQNVAYADGRVEWAKTPFAGGEQDNIYTRAAINPSVPRKPMSDQASDTDPLSAFGGQPPTNSLDSILLPTATVTPGKESLPW